jgi:hypothetical protein
MHALQNSLLKEQKKQADQRFKEKVAELRQKSEPELQRAIDLANIKGASTWLTARPLYKHKTVLQKSDFRDALYLRYGLEPRNLPDACGCGKPFNVAHAMQCMTGGYRGLMHNEVQNCFVEFFKTAGFLNVNKEPQLLPLEGEEKSFKFKTANKEEEARSDICVLGFYSKMRRAYFDITAFSPYARSTKNQSLAQLFRSREKRKRHEYGERIHQVDHGDFTPLVFCTSGGMGPEAEVVIKRLGHQLAERQELSPSVTISWLRCRISFAILRSALVCLRGSRPLKRLSTEGEEIELTVAETDIETSRY